MRRDVRAVARATVPPGSLHGPRCGPITRLTRRVYKTVTLPIRSSFAGADTVVPHNEVGGLQFFQFNERTAQYLNGLAGDARPTVRTTPHTRYAQDLANGVQVGPGRQIYEGYLRTSWKNFTPASIDRKLLRFADYFDKVRRHAIEMQPVILTRLSSSKPHFVVDGNHRAAIALALGRDLNARIIPFDIALRTSLPGQGYDYGLLNPKAAEEFRIGGEIIIPSRLSAKRFFARLPNGAIKDKSVLDLNCGFGARAILAHKLGAAKVLGLDGRRRFADIATRAAIFSGCWPDVTFKTGDAHTIANVLRGECSTVFCTLPTADEAYMQGLIEVISPLSWQTMYMATAADLSAPGFDRLRRFAPVRLGKKPGGSRSDCNATVWQLVRPR